MPIIERAEREGTLRPGGTIVEGTSGNTGVGLAIAAALKGYRCIFTMPDKMSQEKVRLLKAFGAEVIVTPTAVPPDHPDNYVVMARRIAAETPNAILADQFYNAGQSRRALRDHRPRALGADRGTDHAFRGGGGHRRHGHRSWAVPQGAKPPHPGDRRGSRGIDPRREMADARGGRCPRARRTKSRASARTRFRERSTWRSRRRVPHGERPGELRDGAPADARGRIVRRRLVGPHRPRGAADSRAEVNDPNACVVTFLCDTGERYLSKVYSDEWMRENQCSTPIA